MFSGLELTEEESVKQAINTLPQGKENEEKTADQKIEEILEFLNQKKRLTESEKHILEIVT